MLGNLLLFFGGDRFRGSPLLLEVEFMQKPFVFQCVMRCLQLFYLKDRIPFLIVAVFDAFRVDFTTVYLVGKLRQRPRFFGRRPSLGAPEGRSGLLQGSPLGRWKGGSLERPFLLFENGKAAYAFCDLQWRRRLHDGEGHLEHGHSFEGVGMKRQSEIFQRTKEKQYSGEKKPPDSGKIRQPGGGFFEGVPSLFLCICPARHFILKAASSLPPAW